MPVPVEEDDSVPVPAPVERSSESSPSTGGREEGLLDSADVDDSLPPLSDSSDELPVWDPPPLMEDPLEEDVVRERMPSRSTRRRRSAERDEMDLTPMVDVTFLLLVFFMITASFSRQKSFETPAPDPETTGARQSQQFLDELEEVSIRVDVDELNRIFVDERLVSDTRVLGDVLRDAMIRDDKRELLLSARDEALHETVVLVLEAAHRAGLQQIRMTNPISSGDG